MKTFDSLVIGSGSGGQTAAYTLKDAGLSTAVIDNRPFGGTCANRGCDPKKVLVGAAEAMDWFERLSQKSVLSGSPHIDWQKLMAFKQSFVQNVPKDTEESLKKAGIEPILGTASFVDQNTISVNGQQIKATHIVIATGATPVKLGIPGEELVTLSDDFLDLTKLPKRIIFIGGGFISFEFAHVARRAGAKVSILHRSEKVLSGFDQDLVSLLVKASEELGITIARNTPVIGVEKISGGLLVKTKSKITGKEQSFETDLVVHGGGRVPNIEGLNLEKGSVQSTKKGITVNEYLQSLSNPAVYAAGDASEYGLPLTPVAGKEGALVAFNILNHNKKKANFSEMPSVVFTTPPLASVGMREDEAKEKGYDIAVKFEETGSWYSSKRINEHHSGYKAIVDKKTGLLLGAHLLGHDSENIINIFSLAIAHKIPARALKDLIYAYPTRSSDIEYMV